MSGSGVNGFLLRALPRARRVLELGGQGPALGDAYKAAHPGASWTPLADGQPVAGDGYDLLVLNDSLGALADPLVALDMLTPHLTDEALLVCAVANGAHAQIVGQMLMGDLTYKSGGIMDPSRPRLFSRSSAYKLLLDAGWLPDLATVFETPPADDPVTRALIETAKLLGAPEGTARRNLGTGQFIIAARRFSDAQGRRGQARISVVVPVNRPLQFHVNIEPSPGLAEIGAEVIPIVGAKTAAEALERGRERASGDWIVYCHQDVYFPIGSGVAITRAADACEGGLFGFAGLSAEGKAGVVIDRWALFDHPPTKRATSMDELAVVLRRDSAHRIDPRLGWHLWATDLIMASPAPVEIVRIPLFHNSLTEIDLSREFDESAGVLRAKYPDVRPIVSLCATIP